MNAIDLNKICEEISNKTSIGNQYLAIKHINSLSDKINNDKDISILDYVMAFASVCSLCNNNNVDLNKYFHIKI